MKKRLFAILLTTAMIFSVISCGSNKTNNQKETKDTPKVETKDEPEEEKIDITSLDAEGVITLFKDGGFPIDNVIVYNAENDVNELLGRPNQYTSKINFADTRYEQSDPENPVGGSVEVFSTEEDANTRLEYLKSLAAQSSAFTEYDYIYKNVLMRIHRQLTPDNAAEYEASFNTISNGDKIEFTGTADTPETNDFSIEELSFDLGIKESNSWVEISGTVTNNSKYTITDIIISYVNSLTNDIVYWGEYETVLPGETSPNSSGDTIDNMETSMENLTPVKYQINALNPDGKEVYITYDAKLNKYEITE